MMLCSAAGAVSVSVIVCLRPPVWRLAFTHHTLLLLPKQ